MKLLTIAMATGALLLALTTSAHAQSENTFGIGAQTMLTGPGGPGLVAGNVSGASFTYDAGVFHIDGIFGLSAGDTTRFGLGGNFWYVIHGGGIADLSVGGGIGVADDGDDDTDFHVNAGAKIRLFLVNNVALSTIVGLGFIFDDDEEANNDEDIIVGGQTVGIMGITYFF
ncbi:MAG: hypothetical protein Tsb0020_34260 [Haliangiales bacterium]